MGVTNCTTKNVCADTCSSGASEHCATCATQTCARSHDENAIECMSHLCAHHNSKDNPDLPVAAERLPVLAIAFSSHADLDSNIETVAGSICSCENSQAVDLGYQSMPITVYNHPGGSPCDADYEELISFSSMRKSDPHADNVEIAPSAGKEWQDKKFGQWKDLRQDLTMLSKELNSCIPPQQDEPKFTRCKTRTSRSTSPRQSSSLSSSAMLEALSRAEVHSSKASGSSSTGKLYEAKLYALASSRRTGEASSRDANEPGGPNEAADLSTKLLIAEARALEAHGKVTEAREVADHLELELNVIKEQEKQTLPSKLKLVNEIMELQDRYHRAMVFLGKPNVEEMERELKKAKEQHEVDEAKRVKKQRRMFAAHPLFASFFRPKAWEEEAADEWTQDWGPKLGSMKTEALEQTIQRERASREEIQKRCNELRAEVDDLQRRHTEKKNEFKSLRPNDILKEEDLRLIQEARQKEIQRDEILGMLSKATHDHKMMNGLLVKKNREFKNLELDQQEATKKQIATVMDVEAEITTIVKQLHRVMAKEQFLNECGTHSSQGWHECEDHVFQKLNTIRNNLCRLLDAIKELHKVELARLQKMDDKMLDAVEHC